MDADARRNAAGDATGVRCVGRGAGGGEGGRREAGLGGTADRTERMRPTDARMIQLIEAEEAVDCVLRDGSRYCGVLRSFGRWDMAIEVEGVGLVTILFHSLHKSNTWVL